MADDVGVRIERGKGATAVVWLEREPVNSMSLEFWRALADALSALERDPKVRSTRSTRSTRRASRGDSDTIERCVDARVARGIARED